MIFFYEQPNAMGARIQTPLEATMSKKHKGGPAPIPKGNQNPMSKPEVVEKVISSTGGGAPLSEQDPKRRLGNYDTAGEHAIEQPDGKKGSDH
jgi:hypothetical protein